MFLSARDAEFQAYLFRSEAVRIGDIELTGQRSPGSRMQAP
jgi:hypothetical protein